MSDCIQSIQETQDRILFILDDVNDARVFELLGSLLDKPNLFFIVTSSKEELWAKNHIPIDHFKLEPALNYLYMMTADFEEDKAKKLAAKLQYFPLPLAIAAGHICSFEKDGYNRCIQDFEGALQKEDNEEAITWKVLEISLKKIEKELSVELLSLIKFFSVFADAPIPRVIINLWFSLKQIDQSQEVLNALYRRSLIEASNSQSFEVPSAIKLGVRQNLQDESVQDIKLKKQALELLLKHSKAESNLDLLVVPHVLHLCNSLSHSPFSLEPQASALMRVWKLAYWKGLYETSLDLIGVIVNSMIQTGRLAVDRPESMIALLYLAKNLLKMGQYRESISILENQLQAIRRKELSGISLGDSTGEKVDPRTLAEIYTTLGVGYTSLGQDARALVAHRQAQFYLEPHNVGSDFDRASNLSNLSYIGVLTLKAKEALNVLASIKEALAQSAESVSLWLSGNRGALKISEAEAISNEEEWRSLAITLCNVGKIYLKEEKFNEALNYQMKALELRHAIFESTHPDLVESYQAIGALYRAQKKYNVALNYQKAAIHIQKRAFAKKSPHLATSYDALALTLSEMGQKEGASEYRHRARGQSAEKPVQSQFQDLLKAVSSTFKYPYFWLEKSCREWLVAYYKKALKVSIMKPEADEKGETSFLFPIDGIYTQLAILEEKGKRDDDHQIGTIKYDPRLETYESAFQARRSVWVEGIFDSTRLKGKKKQRVLIYGSAGSGKTMTSFRLASQATTLWRDCSVLFLIEFRNLSEKRYPSRDEGYSLSEVIAKECGLNLAEYQALLEDKEFRDRAILLLDGYDESSQALKEEGSLEGLLSDFDKDFKRIIVTSRPGRSYPPGFEECLKLEITGFNKENQNLYINRFFLNALKDKEKATEKSRALQKSLVFQPLVNSVAHIPNYLCFICSQALQEVPLFSDQRSTTMSDFYTHMVGWLYKVAPCRFSPGGGPANLQKQIDSTKDSKINQMERILEAAAWEAMVQDSLDIPQSTLLAFSEEKQLNFSDSIDLGLVNCEEGEVYRFAYLSYQEYFAASALARLYLEGDQEEALGKIKEIKFISCYQRVLSMTAGILSLKIHHPDALKRYFADLMQEPRDLAQSYELQLFARCFEECVSVKAVSNSYSEFIQSALQYFQEADWVELRYRLLNGNHELLHHSEMERVIIEGLLNPKQCEITLQLLHRLAKNSNPLPPNIVRHLVDVCICKESFNGGRSSYAIEITSFLIESGIPVNEEAQQALVTCLRSQETGWAADAARSTAAKVLQEMAKSGALTDSEGVQQALVECLRSEERGDVANRARSAAAKALHEIAKSGALTDSEGVQQALVECLRSQETGWAANAARSAAAKALHEMAKSGEPLIEGVQQALVGCVMSEKTGNGAHAARSAAAEALHEMAKSGALTDSERAQQALVTCLRSQETGWAADATRSAAAKALQEVAKSGVLIDSERAQQALVECLRSEERGDVANRARKAAAEALQEMAKFGALTDREWAQQALIGCLRSEEAGDAANLAREAAAKALQEMAKSGALTDSEGVQQALFECLRIEDAGWAADRMRKAAAKALQEMAKSGALTDRERAQQALVGYLMIKDTGWAADKARKAAAEALQEMAKFGALTDREWAQQALIGCLRSQETGWAADKARSAAAKALQEMAKSGALTDSERAQQALVECLRSEERGELANRAREAAAKVLQEVAKSGVLIDSKSAQQALVECLRSEERGEAANLAREAAAEVLQEMAKSGAPLIEGAQEALVECLMSGETGWAANKARSAAAEVLQEMAKSGAPLIEGAQEALVECLRSEERGEAANWVRRVTAEALQKVAKSRALIDSERAQQALVECLRSEEAGDDANWAREAAAKALQEVVKSGAFLIEDAQQALVECLMSQETGWAADKVRGAAVKALQEMAKSGAPLIIEKVEQVLAGCLMSEETGDAANRARSAAAKALQEMAKSGALTDSERAQEALVECLRSEERGYIANGLREVAAEALQEVAKSGAPLIEKVQQAFAECLRSEERRYTANRLREVAVEALQEVAKSGAPLIEKVEQALVECLMSEERGYIANRLREVAVEVLQELAKTGALIDSKSAQRALAGCLMSGETGEAANRLREVAVEALQEMAKSGAPLIERAQQALLGCLMSQEKGDAANWLRRAAAEALQEVAKSGVPLIEEVQRALVACLMSQEKGDAANWLRRAAAEALQEVAKSGAPLIKGAQRALVACLKSEETGEAADRTRKAAAKALQEVAKSGAPLIEEVQRALVGCLRSEEKGRAADEARGAAAEALRAIGKDKNLQNREACYYSSLPFVPVQGKGKEKEEKKKGSIPISG